MGCLRPRHRMIAAARTLVAAGAAVVGAWIAPAGAEAQQGGALARVLAEVPAGASVRLAAPGVVVDDGTLLSVSPDSLRVREASLELTLALDEVIRLAVLERGGLGGAVRGGVMGAAVAGFGGMIFAWQDCGSLSGCGVLEHGLTGAALGAAAGGVVGWLLGRRSRRWTQVFPDQP